MMYKEMDFRISAANTFTTFIRMTRLVSAHQYTVRSFEEALWGGATALYY